MSGVHVPNADGADVKEKNLQKTKKKPKKTNNQKKKITIA